MNIDPKKYSKTAYNFDVDKLKELEKLNYKKPLIDFLVLLFTIILLSKVSINIITFNIFHDDFYRAKRCGRGPRRGGPTFHDFAQTLIKRAHTRPDTRLKRPNSVPEAGSDETSPADTRNGRQAAQNALQAGHWHHDQQQLRPVEHREVERGALCKPPTLSAASR